MAKEPVNFAGPIASMTSALIAQMPVYTIQDCTEYNFLHSGRMAWLKTASGNQKIRVKGNTCFTTSQNHECSGPKKKKNF